MVTGKQTSYAADVRGRVQRFVERQLANLVIYEQSGKMTAESAAANRDAFAKVSAAIERHAEDVRYWIELDQNSIGPESYAKMILAGKMD